tara:strand:- start:675 stop:1010 length:336 start_codon:yes stop_codon:yes gene_type:complete
MLEERNIYTVCRECQRKTHIAELKTDLETKQMICMHCYREKNNFEEERQEFKRKEITRLKGNTKYICKWCDYKFFSNKSQGHHTICPSCSKKNTLYKDIKSEEALKDNFLR